MGLRPVCGHADRHTTADENAPYPPTLEGSNTPPELGGGGLFSRKRNPT